MRSYWFLFGSFNIKELVRCFQDSHIDGDYHFEFRFEPGMGSITTLKDHLVAANKVVGDIRCNHIENIEHAREIVKSYSAVYDYLIFDEFDAASDEIQKEITNLVSKDKVCFFLRTT